MADAATFIERLFKTIQDGDLGQIVRLFAPDCVFVDVTQPAPVEGRTAIRAVMAERFAGLPDFRPAKWSLISKGEQVAAELELEGSHLGPYLGYPATGALIHWPASSLYTLNRAHDQILREVDYYDLAGVTRQLAAAAPLTQGARRPEASRPG
jgi:steroid delta-isomerase-like uncharacterized protein